jgi:hypothetical protein
MSLLAVETLVYQFLQVLIDRALPEQPLSQLELHENLYRPIKTHKGLRVGYVTSQLSLNPETEIQEYDANLTLVAYAYLKKSDSALYNKGIQTVLTIAAEVVKAIQLDGTLGNRVCRTRVLPAGRGIEELNANDYAVLNLPIIINEM